MAQCFAHRGAAHAEAVTQITLDQTITRQQLKVHDCAAQLVQHDLAQRDGVAVDLEGVVERQAFHRVCSEWGCQSKNVTGNKVSLMSATRTLRGLLHGPDG